MITPFVGEIVLYAFPFAPQGWAACAGQLLPISENVALFELIKTEFGGDGVNDFALPDYRSVAPTGLQYCIALQGLYPTPNGESRPAGVGELALLPYSFAPNTWLDCTGQLLPTSEYVALFQAIGTTFGGDGERTFGLPNLSTTQPTAPSSPAQAASLSATSLYYIAGAGGSAPAPPLLAEVRLFPFQAAPAGWMICAGQLLPIAQYQALFSLIGTTFGGDGQSNFALPDLRNAAVPAGTHYCIATNEPNATKPASAA